MLFRSGNEGVAWATRNTKYAIGYVELAYAKSNGMTVAYLQNGDKTAFVEPTFENVFQAADSYPIANIPKPQDDWSQVSMVLAPGQNSYPIVSFTYLLLYEDLDQAVSDKDTAKTLVQMVSWMIIDGQKFSQPLGYVPLPKAIQELDKQGLARIKFYGEQILANGANSSSKSENTQTKVDTKSDTKKEIKVEKKSDIKKNTKITETKTVKKDTKTVKKDTKITKAITKN